MHQKTIERESFSFPEMEEEILQFWSKNTIFQRSLQKNKDGKLSIFYDGPPFATGLPHHGHLLGSTLKDIIGRYFTMKGFYMERRFGWDCHGLPIEHEINKKLKSNTREAVKHLGVKGYNDECRKIVQLFTGEWEKTITRLGRWVDFKNNYKTMDTPFMESVWHVFKELWDKDLIYKGRKIMPLSTALETVLSNFESGLNYQNVQDPSITVLFKLEDEDNTYLAIWTTTPWSLPSNLGICAGKNIDYIKVYDEKICKNIILAKDRLKFFQTKRNFHILENFKGDKLLKKHYTPLFPYYKHLKEKGAFQIFNDDYVSTENGTGLVSLAPSFGEDDHRIMEEANLNFSACPVDNRGCFTDPVADYKNLYVKDADKKIISRLKKEGSLYRQDVIVHSYPYCYRSDTPLLYKEIPSWFIKVKSLREKLIRTNEQIQWVPKHIQKGRFGKWLQNAKDWAISRNRIWGTPLPVWENDITGKFICIGSIDELKNYTSHTVEDLHRENIDHLTFKLPQEEGTYRRIDEVLDCWFESGSMPYAQMHYPFENQDIFKKSFPAEFITEGVDQTRGWFYTLHVLSTALHNKPAFKNVIVNGLVLAEDGKKMSKRLHNFTPPQKLMDQFGADALRLYLINSSLVKGEEQHFKNTGVKDMVRRVLLPWYNAFHFFSLYAKIDKIKLTTVLSSEDEIDRWIISRLQTLKKNIEKEMKNYHLYNVIPSLFIFLEDLTNWYIRLNRSRFWLEDDRIEKASAYSTLFILIKEFTTIMAPFAPFLSEYIFLQLKSFQADKEDSIHLSSYPVSCTELIDPKLETAISMMQEIVLLGRQKRNQMHIKTKIPLRGLTIIHKDEKILREIKTLESLLKLELHVKEIFYSQDESRFIKLYALPHSKVLGKRLGSRSQRYFELIRKLSVEQVNSYEIAKKITLDGITFTDDDILIYREAREGMHTLSNRFISIHLDCNLSQDLLDEGLAREIVNRIQKMRKEMNFRINDRIQIFYKGDLPLEKIFLFHKDYIVKETLAIVTKKQDSIDPHYKIHAIENMSFAIKIEKISCSE